MANVLIIDDESSICKMISRYIKGMKHDVSFCLTLAEGLQEVSENPYDIVFLDVNLPDGNGIEALPGIRKAPGSPLVIIITGEGDPDGAELAIKNGAWTYIEKPFDIKNLTLQFIRALEYREAKAGAMKPTLLKREGIIGSDPRLETCLDLVAQVTASDVNVLITGETGTGKEQFAKAIHENSSRAKKNFVVVDCTALPETLVESLLFGHEKGAFTGAERSRTGLVKEANGGTLFLDEVGELPLNTQKDFLRVLQESRFRPLGSSREDSSDFRLVSATNRDLEELVRSGRFRKDLFFRLHSAAIELPPLRARAGDIKELAIHYMNKFCDIYDMETKGFTPEFFETCLSYEWPGNVRELVHTMESVLTAARFEPTLFPWHLPAKIRIHQARAVIHKKDKAGANAFEAPHSPEILSKLQDVREAAISKVEKQYLHDLKLFTKKDLKEACRISGLSQSRLYTLLKKYDIKAG